MNYFDWVITVCQALVTHKLTLSYTYLLCPKLPRGESQNLVSWLSVVGQTFSYAWSCSSTALLGTPLWNWPQEKPLPGLRQCEWSLVSKLGKRTMWTPEFQVPMRTQAMPGNKTPILGLISTLRFSSLYHIGLLSNVAASFVMHCINALSEPAVALMIWKKDEESAWCMAPSSREGSAQQIPSRIARYTGHLDRFIRGIPSLHWERGVSLMLEFINIIMCHDLLSPKQPRHQSTFCCCFDLTFWGEKNERPLFFS